MRTNNSGGWNGSLASKRRNEEGFDAMWVKW